MEQKKIYLLFAALTMFGFLFAQTASAALTNRYVVKDNPGAAAPYDSMANAAGDIQTAINYVSTVAGSTVLVAAATYDSGGTIIAPVLTNRVYISKAITVRSIDNNPATTIIKGAWDPITTNGPAAVRCVYMLNGSSLIGFTLTNGATIRTNEVATKLSLGTSGNGGGVYAQSAQAVISNCIITGNLAYGDPYNSALGGGGVFNGAYFNCTFRGNNCLCYGGGAESAILSNCTIVGNSAVGRGGGANNCTLYGCLVSNNIAATNSGYGGGAQGGTLYDCTLITNMAYYGGGASGATVISNCTIFFNVALGAGGGVNNSTLFNCTVISNRSPSGGGTYAGSLRNCILAYNVGLGGGAAIPSTVYNCLIYGNSGYGGGIYMGNGCKVDACTIVGNNSGVLIEGAGKGTVINSIIYSNSANWVTNPTAPVIVFSNTCTYPAYAGWDASNTTNNPLFVAFGSGFGVAHIPGNYRLQANSPCMNRGLNQAWMTNALDLDGRTRIRYGTVDMGAYEVIYDGTIYKFR